jgi:hypothetical protein
LTHRETHERFEWEMKLRLALLAAALSLALGLVGTQGAAASKAREAAGAAHADAAAKKCKRPKARHRGRCVRRCPAGFVKKPNQRWGRKCVRKRTPGTPAPPTPNDPGPAPTGMFEKPSGELTGQAAFDHFSRYFLNSRFTDCPAGWPNCAVEERYDQCANYSWAYHRYTPTSGSDINSYGSYTVTGAAAHPDGSWQVEYVVDAYGSQSFYSWDVAPAGTVIGRYWAPGTAPPSPPSQNLGPLRYQQPTDCGA